MNNKLKSLIYLSCFMIMAVLYHVDSSTEMDKKVVDTAKTTEADITINPLTQDLGE
ncbi:hypothetical protein [Maribacter sp. 4U21]|uniref:hypothetical protein n=1 Tax=Maribacter sp. 4U21 TaxID=1889779 RepID=UPI0015D4B319|nr:hypothetical protein [Maribacter sp. 4U21]